MKRALSLFVCFSMLMGALALVGCPAPDSGSTTTTTENGNQGKPLAGDYADGLDTEAIVAEVAGRTLTLSVFETAQYEVYAEEDSKDPLDQMIYKRNKKIEERFGVTIAYDITKAKNETDSGSHYYYVLDELRSMAPSFDWIGLMQYQSGKLVTQNYCRDWRAAVPYARESLAAEDPWWPTSLNQKIVVNGRQFLAVSDMCITAIDQAMGFLFNETKVESLNVVPTYAASKQESYATMYDIVKAGAWTMDAMIAITKDLWVDNEVHGKKDEPDLEDIIGLYCDQYSDIDNFTYACGFAYIDNDGKADPTVWRPLQTYDTMVEKLRTLFNDGKGAMYGLTDGYLAPSDRTKTFAEEHFVFMAGQLSLFKSSVIRGMDDNYGLVPYPKLDGDQQAYQTQIAGVTALVIPRYTVGKQLKLAGAMTVALSAETYNSINEPYYEMVIKHDSGFVNREAVGMIDLIMQGRVYDLSAYHFRMLQFDGQEVSNGSLGLYLRYLMIDAPNQTATGLWESAGDVCKTRLKELVDTYAALK